MRHSLFVRLLSIASSLVVLAGAARAADSNASPGGNAAMKYWQAFALLPSLSPEQEKIVQGWSTAPLDAAAQKVIEESQGSRDYLLRGAKLDRCDWSLDYEDGVFLRIPYAPKALQSARLTALHARHEFSQAHWDEGWQDVTALFKLAHHVETEPVMIVQLVGYAIEGVAIETAAPYLPNLKQSLGPDAASLAAPPAEPTLAQLVEKEKQMGPLWLIGRLKAADRAKPGAWKAVWKQTMDAALGANEGPSAGRVEIPSPKSLGEAVKTISDLLPLYDEQMKLAALPYHQFDAEYPTFAKKAMEGNSLAKAFAPNLDKFEHSRRRRQARAAMFQAAIAIVEGGQKNVGDSKDPFGDGPFSYHPSGHGFELTSNLQDKGKPMSLMVGQGK